MILTITEKKKQAEDLASAMGWSKGRGCYSGTYEGKEIRVVWASGHLVTLKQPREIIENIVWDDPSILTPMPQKFELKVNADVPKLPPHAQPKAYLKNIELHLKEASEVIIATDADREGEAVAWYILNYLGFTGPCRRAWFSKGLDSVSLKEAMNNLRPSLSTKGWFRAAESRGRADWYYMLLVIAYTHYASYGIFGKFLGRGKDSKERVMSVGRVQTPALAIILNRDIEIENFVAKDHWKLSSTFSSGSSGVLEANYIPEYTQQTIDSNLPGISWEPSKVIPKDGDLAPLDKPLFTDKTEIESFKNRLLDAKNLATVKSYKEGSRSSNPPKTFALSDAQGALIKACKISGSLAQIVFEDLYEQGWISYARTSKQGLPENFYLAEERNNLLNSVKQLSSVLNQANIAADIHNGTHDKWRPFKPKVFTKEHLEHHGMIPTKKVMTDSQFSSLQPVKKNKNSVQHTRLHMQTAYELVAKQFIQALYPSAEFATQTVEFSVPVKDMMGNDISNFSAKGERIVDEGYLSAFMGGSSKNTEFPKVNNGDSATVENILLKSSRTKPPSRFDEITYLKALENVGKEVTDPKLRKALEKADGLGTPATRKTIVETLLARGYMEIKSGTFHSTMKGRELINSVPSWLSSPENTALWENYLVKICDQKNDEDAVKMRDGFVSKQRLQLENLIQELQAKFDGNKGQKIQNAPSKVTPRMKEAIEQIAKIKNIEIPRGALTNPEKAQGFLDEHMVKRDPNDKTPSEGQVKFLNSLISKLPNDTIVPESVFTDRDICSQFINDNKGKMPPTEKALEYAKKLSQQSSVPLPADASTSFTSCAAFIEKYKDQVPPSEGQKNFAVKIIEALPEGTVVPNDVLTNIGACKKFIDGNKYILNSKGGKSAGSKTTRKPYVKKK